MRAVFSIAWKDLRNLLSSPLFFVVAGGCASVWSLTYMNNLAMFAQRAPMGGESQNIQQAVFLPHISLLNLLLIFVMPALTMRLLSEEKRMRTYDLLLTSPVTSTQIALGKFLAGLGMAAALIVVSMIYPLATRLVAEYPMGPLASAYIGVFLVASAYVATGLFASSLTESMMLSVVLALIFNILLWFISQSGGDSNTWFSPVLEYMSLGQHFWNFILGAFKLNSIVFFLSLIGLFVFMAQRVIESSRWR